jgi:hypothetical protein
MAEPGYQEAMETPPPRPVPAALTDEELAEMDGWTYLGPELVSRLIAALRASRAEVERLEQHHREMHDPLA